MKQTKLTADKFWLSATSVSYNMQNTLLFKKKNIKNIQNIYQQQRNMMSLFELRIVP